METKTYGGFWWRLLAFLIDVGFSILRIPIIINIYYYFKEGTTLGYKATGLIIKKSQDESTKPGGWRLFGRFLAKTLFFLVLISLVWFIVSMIFWFVQTLTGGLGEYLTIVKGTINWLLGISALLSFFGFFSRITIPFNKRKRGVHDLLAKTVVIRTGPINKRLLIIGCILFIIVFWANNYYLPQFVEQQNQLSTEMQAQVQDIGDQAVGEEQNQLPTDMQAQVQDVIDQAAAQQQEGGE